MSSFMREKSLEDKLLMTQKFNLKEARRNKLLPKGIWKNENQTKITSRKLSMISKKQEMRTSLKTLY